MAYTLDDVITFLDDEEVDPRLPNGLTESQGCGVALTRGNDELGGPKRDVQKRARLLTALRRRTNGYTPTRFFTLLSSGMGWSPDLIEDACRNGWKATEALAFTATVKDLGATPVSMEQLIDLNTSIDAYVAALTERDPKTTPPADEVARTKATLLKEAYEALGSRDDATGWSALNNFFDGHDKHIGAGLLLAWPNVDALDALLIGARASMQVANSNTFWYTARAFANDTRRMTTDRWAHVAQWLLDAMGSPQRNDLRDWMSMWVSRCLYVTYRAAELDSLYAALGFAILSNTNLECVNPETVEPHRTQADEVWDSLLSSLSGEELSPQAQEVLVVLAATAETDWHCLPEIAQALCVA